MTAQSFTLYDMLTRNALAFGERPAILSEEGHTRTYRQLLADVDRLASGLSAAGLESGGRVCILAQNDPAYLDLYFACARLGAVAYPINWRLKPEEVGRLLDRAEPFALVADPASLELIPAGPTVDRINLRILLGGQSTPEGQEVPEGFQTLNSLYSDTPASNVRQSSPVLGDDPFAIIATAAVEVVPRGAVLTHSNVLWANLQEIAGMGLKADDSTLVCLPLFHIAALSHCLAFLHAGGFCVVTSRYDPEQAVELIDRHKITHLSDFPPVLSLLLDAAQKKGSALPSLRHVSGLDSPETMQRLLDETQAEFWTGFGQTETTGFVTLQKFRDQPGASGKPGEVSSIRLVDDLDQDVPLGEPGEILVRGPLVFAGYADEPEVTAHTFRGGWHHTGDVGRFDEEGYLYYVKRKPEKELIKPGGENVYPAEVETVILELDGVTGACVFGVPHKKWGEGIKAVVETAEGAELTAKVVIDHVGNRIARYKKPHFVDFTPDLPRTESGEIDRDSVKESFRAEAE